MEKILYCAAGEEEWESGEWFYTLEECKEYHTNKTSFCKIKVTIEVEEEFDIEEGASDE